LATGSSVADGEALALVPGLFQLVDESDGIVLHGDAAVALGVADELIFAETELARSLAGFEEACRTEAGPVDSGLLNEVESVAVGFCDASPFGGQMSALEEGDARSDFEAGGSADVEEAANVGILYGFDEVAGDGDKLIGIAERRSVGADDGVGSLNVDGNGGGGVYASLLNGQVGLRGEFVRVTGDGGDLMAAGKQFGEDATAGVAGSSVEDDVHEVSPLQI